MSLLRWPSLSQGLLGYLINLRLLGSATPVEKGRTFDCLGRYPDDMIVLIPQLEGKRCCLISYGMSTV